MNTTKLIYAQFGTSNSYAYEILLSRPNDIPNWYVIMSLETSNARKPKHLQFWMILNIKCHFFPIFLLKMVDRFYVFYRLHKFPTKSINLLGWRWRKGFYWCQQKCVHVFWFVRSSYVFIVGVLVPCLLIFAIFWTPEYISYILFIKGSISKTYLRFQ